MKQSTLLMSLLILVLSPGLGVSGPLNPCTVVATANANTLIQAPSYSESIDFDTNATPDFADCTGAVAPTTATIIVANPPQNPPPTAPVYLALNGAAAGTPQVMLALGTTVITSSQFPGWFPSTGTPTPSFSGVTVYSPGTPWVPASITIIWQ